MTALVVRDIRHSFGGPPVLDGAGFRVEKGERVCIVGRNGEGKSTLLKIIAGTLKPDAGHVDKVAGATIAHLEQAVPDADSGSVYEVVTSGLGDASEALNRFHAAAHNVAEDPSDQNLAALERAQTAVDQHDAWAIQARVETAISRLGLNADQPFAELSGGWRRRAFLARALVSSPTVLILDEPTNHLDVEAVEWLENLLLGFEGAVVFITHDRAFLRAVATRIVDLDRGQLTEYPGDYDVYLERKSHDLEVEESHNAQFDKKLAEEEAWIRTGIKARRTRNEGRVRALKAMRSERRQRRTAKSQATFSVQSADATGDIVFELDDVSFGYDAPLIQNLSLIVSRKSRIGFIGPNGVGKTTLIRLMLGRLQADSGVVTQGTNLKVRYFDQLRDSLDPTQTVREIVAPDGDQVIVNDKPIHVFGYLRRFLFNESQARTPVSVLSGGERARVVLAKLFSEPANVLVLDEPTNDLDIETLELLEVLLTEFDGTVLLVSHDREFLDNVVTESLVFRGNAEIVHVVGGYSEWDRLRQEALAEEAAKAKAERESARQKEQETHRETQPRKLTYKEKQELEQIPELIESLETEQTKLHEELSNPDLYRESPEKVSAINARLEAIEEELMLALERWEELET